jgi:hypothetical protein
VKITISAVSGDAVRQHDVLIRMYVGQGSMMKLRTAVGKPGNRSSALSNHLLSKHATCSVGNSYKNYVQPMNKLNETLITKGLQQIATIHYSLLI